MKEQSTEILFQYSLEDAWTMPIHTITVYKNGNLNLYEKNKNFSNAEKSISVEALEKIKEVLKTNNVVFSDSFKIEEIKHCLILDGYIHKFVFQSGENKKVIRVFNLDCFEMSVNKHPNETMQSEYPNVCILIGILDALKKVLSNDVENKFFDIME